MMAVAAREPTTGAAPEPGLPPDRARRGRLKRFALWCTGTVLMLALAAGLTLWILTRSWYVVSRAEPVLAELLGADVTIERALFLGQGRFDLEGVLICAPNLSGPESQVGRIERAEVQLDPAALRRGRADLRGLVLHDFVLRISEDEGHASRFNISGLRPVMERSDAGTLPPTIEIASGRIELAEHGPDRFHIRATRGITGSLRPARARGAQFDFQLEVAPDQPAQETLRLSGSWDLSRGGLEISLGDLTLDEPLRQACPGYLRAWWEHLELDGRVEDAHFAWSPQAGVAASINVRGAGITMPIQTEAFWQWYRLGRVERHGGRPRMLVSGGRIEFSDNALTLRDLNGRFVAQEAGMASAEIPYVVNLTLSDLPRFSWDDRVAWTDAVTRASMFELEFQGSGLEVRSAPGEEPPAIILPTAVVDALRRFRLTEWTLSTTVRASRAAPQRIRDDTGAEVLIAAPIEATGQAMLRRARGAFEAFPYAMDDVSATIEFTHEHVVIHELRGRGSQGSTLRLSGRAELPGTGEAMSLQLRATNLPLDDRLRAALPEEQRAVYDAVLHAESVRKLAEAGLLVDESMIESLRAAHTHADSRDSPQRQAEANVIASGAFELGGVIDVDMTIERGRGADGQLSASGRITFDRLGLVYEDVPYPLLLERGAVEWSPAHVRLSGRDGEEGIRLLTAGGGAGMLSGEVDLVPAQDGEGLDLRPRLALDVRGDAITDRLLAALPPQADERTILGEQWPGAALSSMARQIELLNFRGVLDYRAAVDTAPDASLDFSALIDLRDGYLDADSALAAWLGADASVVSVPRDGDGDVVGVAGDAMREKATWRMDDVRASLAIRADQVELTSLSARCLGAVVEASGSFEIASGDLALHADMRDLPLSRSFVALLPEHLRTDADAFWSAHDPEGRISAAALWRRSAGEDVMSATIRPHELSLRANGQPVSLTHRGGDLEIDATGVRFRDLALRIGSPRADEGDLTMTGYLGFGEKRSVLSFAWQDGRFASPLVAQLAEWFATDDQRAILRDLAPDGGFTLQLSARDDGTERRFRSWRAQLTPQDLVVTVRGQPLHLTFAPHAALTIEPDYVTVRGLHGRAAAGTFSADGTVRFGEVLDARFDVGFAGRLASPMVVAMLPEEAARVVRGLSVTEQAITRLTSGHVRFVRRMSDGEPAWSFSADGLLALSGVGMDIGLDLRDVHGDLDFSVSARHDAVPRMRIDADLLSARILDQQVRSARFRLSLDDTARSILLRDLTGRLSQGTLVAASDIALRSGERHHVDVRIFGAPVAGWSIQDVPDVPVPGDEEDGEVFAAVEFSSIRGDESSRTGRGLVRITNGRVAAIPFALQIVQMMQLSFPVQRMQYAEADFFIVGSVVHVERMLMESVSGGAAVQQLIGSGEIDLDARMLDLRFRSRGSVALLRDLLGELGDRMASISVTGPMDDPETNLIPLPGRGERSTTPVLAPPHRGRGLRPAVDPRPRAATVQAEGAGEGIMP